MKVTINLSGYATKDVYEDDGLVSWGPTIYKTKKKRVPARIIKTSIKTALEEAGIEWAASHGNAQRRFAGSSAVKRRFRKLFVRSGVTPL